MNCLIQAAENSSKTFLVQIDLVSNKSLGLFVCTYLIASYLFAVIVVWSIYPKQTYCGANIILRWSMGLLPLFLTLVKLQLVISCIQPVKTMESTPELEI